MEYFSSASVKKESKTDNKNKWDEEKLESTELTSKESNYKSKA